MRIRTWMSMMFGAAVGAAATYLMDPDRGPQRRVETRDRAMRKAQELDLDTRAKHYAGQVRGTILDATSKVRSSTPANDQALAAKVRSEVIGQSSYPSGEINVDAADGVVTLRGQIPNQRLIDEIVERTEQVDGVTEVRNLLQMPSEAAATAGATSESSTTT